MKNCKELDHKLNLNLNSIYNLLIYSQKTTILEFIQILGYIE